MSDDLRIAAGDRSYSEGSQSEGAHGEDSYSEGAHSEAPQSEDPQGEAPNSEGSYNEGSRRGEAYRGEAHRLGALVVFVGYTLLTAYVSLRPADGISIGHWDKVYHFGFYALFAMLAWWLTGGGRRFGYLCVAIVVYSGLLEVAQSYMPGRHMSGFDLLANALGVMTGAGVSLWLAPRLRSRAVNPPH